MVMMPEKSFGVGEIDPPQILQEQVLDYLHEYGLLTPARAVEQIQREDPELAFYLETCRVFLGRITPEIAKVILTNFNLKNRTIVGSQMKALNESAKEDELMLINNALAFDHTWDFIDGQHRLQMLIENNVTMLMFVMSGFDPRAALVIDGVSVRRAFQDLERKGVKNARSVQGVADYYYRYINARMKFSGGTADKRSRFKKHPETMAMEGDIQPSTRAGFRVYDAVRGSQQTYSFCHYIFTKVDTSDQGVDARELADQFFEDLATGAMLHPKDPVLVVREILRDNITMTRKTGRYKERLDYAQIAAAIINAWNYRRKGKQVSRKSQLIWKGYETGAPFPIAI